MCLPEAFITDNLNQISQAMYLMNKQDNQIRTYRPHQIACLRCVYDQNSTEVGDTINKNDAQ